MTWKGKWPGTWAVNCDVCGFRFPSDKLIKRWDGAMVCKEDWETRHPQTLIRIHGEKAHPTYTRHNPVNYLYVCTPWGSSPMANYGAAGCMVVGGISNINVLYDAMAPTRCIAGIAIASQTVSGWTNLGNI